MKILKIFISLHFCLLGFLAHSQINRSQASNYQAQKTSIHNYASNYQNGFVILLDNARLEGEISIMGYSYERLYGLNLKLNSGEKYKFHLRSLLEYGLSENLTNDTPGEFRWYAVDKIKLGSNTGAPAKPSNTRKGSSDYGYVVTKEGTTYHGKISIKEVRKKVIQIDVKTIDKQKFKFEAAQLTNFGVGKRQSSDVSQTSPIRAQSSSKSNYTEPIYVDDLSGDINGYVILSNGERKIGEIGISQPPNVGFVRHVTLTEPNGEVSYFSPIDKLLRIIKTTGGSIKEFVYFEGEYVEVLDRVDFLVHFRNPHPTTLSLGGELASATTGAAFESADQQLRAAGGSVTKTSKPKEDTDWTSEEVVKLYAKEHMILNEKSGRSAMYIPGKKYWQIEAELMGTIHFLRLPKEGQEALRMMKKPLRTMNYLNEKLYSRSSY